MTKAAGSVLDEIDGKPAVDFYRQYLGPGTKPTAEVPLAVLSMVGTRAKVKATPARIISDAVS